MVKESEALDRPQLEWQLPRGLHRGDIERFGGEAEGSRGCRGNEMSWLAALFARGQGLYRAGEAVAHAAHGGSVDGGQVLAGTLC